MGDLDQAITAGKVPPDKEAEIRATWQALRGELATALRRLRLQALDRRRPGEVERGVARRMLDEIAVDVRTRFPQPPVVAQLEEAARHFIDRFAAYGRALLEAAEESGGRPDAYRLAAEEVLREFRVNLLLDAREGTGCPTVIEAQPTWTNLFGQVERDVDAKGNPRTDFLLIRPGSLLLPTGATSSSRRATSSGRRASGRSSSASSGTGGSRSGRPSRSCPARRSCSTPTRSR